MTKPEEVRENERLSTMQVDALTAIFSGRKLPGTRNGPITEPRELAEYVVATLNQKDTSQ